MLHFHGKHLSENDSEDRMLPVKQTRIYSFGQSIPANCCAKGIKTSFNNFFWSNHYTLTQCIFQCPRITPEIWIRQIKTALWLKEKSMNYVYSKAWVTHEKFCCHLKMKKGFIIFQNRWVIIFPIGKIYITKVKNCSYNSENSLLRDETKLFPDFQYNDT